MKNSKLIAAAAVLVPFLESDAAFAPDTNDVICAQAIIDEAGEAGTEVLRRLQRVYRGFPADQENFMPTISGERQKI